MENGDCGLYELCSKKDLAFLDVLPVFDVQRKVSFAEPH
jgi:hypothetical protein